MPYENKYNANIANTVNQMHQTHANHENATNDNVQPNDVTSQLESMALKHPGVKGGSGYAAATLQDLGFEPTLGATGDAKPKRARKKKGEGIAGAGMAGAGDCGRVVGEGIAGAGKRSRKKGGALLTLKDLDSMHGQPPDTVNAKTTIQARPHVSEQVGDGAPSAEVGGARKKRNDLVRAIMKSHKLSLPEASKHIKAHKLY